METITLFRDGDVYIAAGPEPTRRYLVSSAVLSNASPVFQAMFSKRFAEGQGLSTGAPKPVSFPEDDPRSMEILLFAMHYHAAADLMVPSEGAAFARLCDKYGCLESMKSYMTSWFAATWEYVWGFDEECQLCATAWHFGDDDSFRKCTANLVLGHEGCFFKAASEGVCDIPIEVLCEWEVVCIRDSLLT
ncbi:hypothetical protein BDZ85DRAFT_29321 [Elsinoe ampelina]|uniref:BTB domain-containing protein n=1 Tax=Elsinoe ampelina TaxID=302913 RepID=A0A6A6G4F5_9PEZI|nr:hypothetical protein BDZ85DRAFT_29321 [Elsinoe ampelina]